MKQMGIEVISPDDPVLPMKLYDLDFIGQKSREAYLSHLWAATLHLTRDPSPH